MVAGWRHGCHCHDENSVSIGHDIDPTSHTDLVLMTPDQYCQERAANSGSSFYSSFRLLPTDQRRAITALYAFCREVDDVVDSGIDPALAAIKLRWWSDELANAYEGKPQHMVTRALAPHLKAFDLPRNIFDDIIDGMSMDLMQSRYANFGELETYCYRAAGTVGILAANIFGFSDPATLTYARELGIALQLINILRDVPEDASRGRIYLPLNELAAHGVTEHDLLACNQTEQARTLFAYQGERAATRYRNALGMLPQADIPAQRTGLAMGAIYRATLAEIEDDGFQVLRHRVALPKLRKIWIAWSTARRAARHRLPKAI